MFRKYLFPLLALALLLSFAAAPLTAQAPRRWSSAEIHQAIDKLNFLGSALYVAAHPDDENTRLIAYLANHVKAETAYLSMTRGDGGQNLIGPEIAEMLGLIRTQELLAARRTDGGNQLFTRANDFGFSKHPNETLQLWNKDRALSDVVWAIRKWRPDVIINRFWHEYEERLAGRMHGHHTASAMLSHEAFDLAGRQDVYPGQLKYVEPWQPRRLYFNSYTWFRDERPVDSSKLAVFDVGVFYPLLGLSNNEIAARSRSMHKCQGFGVPLTRGSEMEELLLLKGDQPADPADIFAGINTTWTRVKGGAPIGKLLQEVEAEYNYEKPYLSVTKLLRARNLIKALPDGHWKRVKLSEIETVIKECLALYLEAAAADFSAVPGQPVPLTIEAINRSPAPVTLKALTFLPQGADTTLNVSLKNNQGLSLKYTTLLPADLSYSSPYWLNEAWELGMYTVGDQLLRGLPETPRQVNVRFDLDIAGEPFAWTTSVVFKRTDPVDGEVYRPFEVMPPVTAAIPEKVYIFANGQPRTIRVSVRAGQEQVSGIARLRAPEGWRVEPAGVPVDIQRKGQDVSVEFAVFPPEQQSEGELHAMVEVNGKLYDRELVFIDYDHIPTQSVLLDSKARIVKVDLRKAGDQVGYIMGAGDDIPSVLQEIGYNVSLLQENDVTAANLARFDAVILGVRAYNTVEWLRFRQADLLSYVRNGGTMIVQYNTNSRLVVPNEELAPYTLRLSRDRVSLEDAPMTALLPDHPVLNVPNKITAADFEGWVQERGLYFPGVWDEEHFQAIFSCQDPGEQPSKGSLLVAKYGDGHYIYTGLSFFRELPAGVPGAFRLFANMISIGQPDRP